jgi:hypothetical protein
MLVALTAFALLCTVLFTSLRIASSALKHVARQQSQVTDLLATERVLAQWVQTAYPAYVPPPLPGLHGVVDFAGGADSMVFLAPAPETVLVGGFARLHLWVARDRGGHENLMLSAQPELALPDAQQVTAEVLLRGIAGARFDFYGQQSGDTLPEWYQTWQNQPTLPRLIRLSVTFPPGDFRHWPVMLVAPVIRADQACQLVTLADKCLGR